LINPIAGQSLYALAQPLIIAPKQNPGF